MKRILAALLGALLVVTISSARGIHYEIYEDHEKGVLLGVIEGEPNRLCTVKINLVRYAMANRDVRTEEDMLKVADGQWTYYNKKYPEEFSGATYVDMQRIVRDAYRINSGRYRRPNTQETLDKFVVDEMEYCITSGF